MLTVTGTVRRKYFDLIIVHILVYFLEFLKFGSIQKQYREQSYIKCVIILEEISCIQGGVVVNYVIITKQL